MSKILKLGIIAFTLALVGAFSLATVQAAAACGPESCEDVAGFCSDVCGGDQQCEAECKADLNDELNCNVGTCGEDGRTNTNCSAPEILYCSGDKANFYLYNYFTGEGTLDFSVSLSDLQKSVTVKTLIKQDGQVKLYLNPDGTALLLAPQPDGKIYFMVFDPFECVSIREGAEWGLK